jgi:predicted secreted protein
MTRFLLAAALVLAVARAAPAQPFQLDPDTRNQLTFGVARTMTVENDEMTVTLAAVHTDLKAAAAADAVNKAMQEALPRVREAEGVKFRTGSYTTRQFYPQPAPAGRPREPRWRAEQELILASRNFETLRALVSDLQASLNLKSVGFGLSEARRIEAEREMSDAALGAFREEAERIRQALGFAGYEIVELQLSNSTHDPLQRRSPVHISSDSMQLEAVAPVVLEGGSSEVGVHVRARIQLLP